MKSVDRARKALRAGGWVSICGNAARICQPGKDPIPIAHGVAISLVESDGLEHFADGHKWPYPSKYRVAFPKIGDQP